MSSVPARTALAVALVALLLVPGCLGTESRTDWAFEVTGLDALNAEGRTGKGVTIAILDTGIDADHPSLDHLLDADLDNGHLAAFRDFLDPKEGVAAAHDPDGHGTHVAGIIAARPSGLGDKLLTGGVELKGGAPGARLVVARVCTSDTCNADAIVAAIGWSVEMGADVLSLSLGGNPNLPGIVGDALQDRMETAVKSAVARGTVVVAAAGNDAFAPGDVTAPANIREVIAVGAIRKDLRLWYVDSDTGSQRGDASANECRRLVLQDVGRCSPNQKPELVAPGVGILSTYADGTYATATGTSQATPFVSAAIALLLQGRPDITDAAGVRAVKVALIESAQSLPDQERPHDEGYGYGLVRADLALRRF